MNAQSAGVPFKVCTDNALFDGGWLMAIAAIAAQTEDPEISPRPMPNYQSTNDAGECQGYLGMYGSWAALKGLLVGLHAARDCHYPTDSSEPLEALRLWAPSIPACACEHDHMPDNDAYVIAFAHLAVQGIRLGIYPLVA